MSEVEAYWQAVANKFGDKRKWSDLTLQQQQIVIQSINALFAVLYNQV